MTRLLPAEGAARTRSKTVVIALMAVTTILTLSACQRGEAIRSSLSPSQTTAASPHRESSTRSGVTTAIETGPLVAAPDFTFHDGEGMASLMNRLNVIFRKYVVAYSLRLMQGKAQMLLGDVQKRPLRIDVRNSDKTYQAIVASSGRASRICSSDPEDDYPGYQSSQWKPLTQSRYDAIRAEFENGTPQDMKAAGDAMWSGIRLATKGTATVDGQTTTRLTGTTLAEDNTTRWTYDLYVTRQGILIKLVMTVVIDGQVSTSTVTVTDVNGPYAGRRDLPSLGSTCR